MLKKYVYGLLISNLIFSEVYAVSLTTPQIVALNNTLANKNIGISANAPGPTPPGNGGNHIASGTPPASIVATSTKSTATNSNVIPTPQVESLLDTRFNAVGIEAGTNVVSFSQDQDYSWSQSVAIDSQGRIVLGGTFNYDNLEHFAVARFLESGTLDASFGDSGIKSFSISEGVSCRVSGVAIDSNDKIILCGNSYLNGIQQFAVAKLTSAGDLDANFNGTGVKAFSIIEGMGCSARSVAIDSSHNIVLSGYHYDDNLIHSQFAVAKIKSDGDLDANFNSTGVMAFSIIENQNSASNGVAIDSNDNIILAGSTYDGLKHNFAVAKLTSAGVLDTNFNSTGVCYFDIIQGQQSEVRSVAIDSNNKIILGGYAYDGGINRFAVAKLTSVGVLDTDFNATGKAYTSINGYEFDCGASAVAIDSKSNAILCGYTYIDGAGTYQTAVARFTSAGIVDTTFNSSGNQHGTAVTTIGGYPESEYNEVYSVAIDSNDKIIVAGYTYFNENNNYSFAVVRFNEFS